LEFFPVWYPNLFFLFIVIAPCLKNSIVTDCELFLGNRNVKEIINKIYSDDIREEASAGMTMLHYSRELHNFIELYECLSLISGE